MRILHLNNIISLTSGVTRHIYNLTRATKNNFENEVICFGGDAIELFKDAGIKIKVLKNRHYLGLLSNYTFLSKYCIENKIDIIHNHHRLFDFITHFIPDKSITRITTVHSKVFGCKPFSYKSSILIAVGESIKNHLINYFHKQPEQVRILNNFIVPEDYSSSIEKHALLKQLSIERGTKVILFVGRFHNDKGVDVLLSAVKLLKENTKDFILIMMGEGKEGNFLQSFAEKYDLPVLIKKPVQNIYDFYNIADIVVLPSRVDPFPYIMLEAGLMKKAFIGSKVDGIAELIKHRENGILFQSENIEGLNSSLKLLLSDESLAKMISENLFKDIIEKYTADNSIPAFVSLYQSF